MDAMLSRLPAMEAGLPPSLAESFPRPWCGDYSLGMIARLLQGVFEMILVSVCRIFHVISGNDPNLFQSCLRPVHYHGDGER